MAEYNFKNLREIDPPEYLSGRILAKIELHKKRMARVKFFLFEGAGLVSLAIALASFKFAIDDFSQSGFSSYASLIFSDLGMVISYWKDFVMLLAESIPLLWFTAFLASILIMLESIKNALKNKRDMFLTSKFI
ncbi:MAG: hypothetical protein ACYC3G_02860 [Minisyncoccota bacterium]